MLPQVTEPWRFSMGAGAASTEAARAMVAMNEVYMLADMGARVGLREVLERKTVCWLAIDEMLLERTVSDGVPDLCTYIFDSRAARRK